ALTRRTRRKQKKDESYMKKLFNSLRDLFPAAAAPALWFMFASPARGDVFWSPVAAGANHTLAVSCDHYVWAWGNNSAGQLGDGTTTERHTPIKVPGIDNVVCVGAGEDFSVALKSDGTVWAWGANSYGQQGDGTLQIRYNPHQVPGIDNII